MSNLFSKDRLLALGCMAMAGYIWAEAGTYPTSDFDAVGPSLYPRFLASVIFLAACVLFVKRGAEKKANGERRFGALIFVGACGTAYALFLETLGFLPVTAAMLFLMVMFFDSAPVKQRLRGACLYAVLFSLFLYLFFGRLLGVLLPVGKIF